MKKLLLQSVMTSLAWFVFSFIGNAQSQTQEKAGAPAIQVIQFHTEHRCYSCLQIEKLTKATLTAYFPSVKFILVNAEDKKNEKIVEQFEAAGTALFLYNPKTNNKKDLTSFAFMKVGNEKLYQAGLKKYIEEFLKS